MSEKNLAQKHGRSGMGIQPFFVVALVIVLIYIFYPYEQKEKVADDAPKPEIYLVVSNGSSIPYIAEDVSAALLKLENINVMKWGNTDNPKCIHNKTQIVIRQETPDQKVKLAYLQELTGIKDVVIAYREGFETEFELILGKDYINYFKK